MTDPAQLAADAAGSHASAACEAAPERGARSVAEHDEPAAGQRALRIFRGGSVGSALMEKLCLSATSLLQTSAHVALLQQQPSVGERQQKEYGL